MLHPTLITAAHAVLAYDDRDATECQRALETNNDCSAYAPIIARQILAGQVPERIGAVRERMVFAVDYAPAHRRDQFWAKLKELRLADRNDCA